jgi:nitroreductase / dihydropteridine reductase
MSLIDNLNWRYATKKMTGQTISQEALDNILEATRLSASSYGLQPYNIVVVSNPEIKHQLLPAAYGQTQITDSSHLLVFSIWENISDTQVSQYINDIAATRGIPVEALKGFADTILGTVKNLSTAERQVWASKQAYIALGTALIAAAEQEVDATPMEGFMPEAFDTILGLKEKGLKSVVVLALGVRSEKDALAGALKVRRAKDAFYSFVA